MQTTTQNDKKNLNHRIHQLLKDKNLENPILMSSVTNWNNATYISQLEAKLADFLCHLGFNLSDDSLVKTPARVIECFINELFYGLNYNNFPDISGTLNNFSRTSPIISKGITVNSTCEHHLVAIQGKAVVAYIPGVTIIGLSKLNQIVDFFARRPQVQERLNRQIFVVLQELLGTEDVAVAINASHNCIRIRGVKDADSMILTLETGGKFERDAVLKQSFYQLASNSNCYL